MFVQKLFRIDVSCDCARAFASPCWVFSPRRNARLEQRRAGIGTYRKTERAARPARSAAFARLPRRAIAWAHLRANTRKNRRQMAENRRLLLPVMIFPRSWFGWRFREITGEIFFARSPRVDHTGSNARKFAGRKSPDLEVQMSDFIESFALQKVSRKMLSIGRRCKLIRWRNLMRVEPPTLTLPTRGRVRVGAGRTITASPG